VESQSKDVPGAHYPFNVAWSPVEIVSIYRVHESKDSCLKLRQMMQYETTGSFDSETTKGTKEVRVEVRWFYRSHEIPGEKKAKDSSETRTDDRDLDEVFETDHLDLCSAESILAPLVIHQKQRKSDQLQDTKNGMPCVHFHGRRYWSIHRKSFVPSGSHSSRVERGRLHSIFFGKHGTAKAALSRLGHKGAPANAQAMVQRGPLPWKEAFQFAIQTLSLAEAAQHAQLHGELTCREKEREEIFNFLKEAICGKHRKFLEEDGSEENVNIKNSIFIAGPPGTGETLKGLGDYIHALFFVIDQLLSTFAPSRQNGIC
jgi:predicted hydrocarbon binding protein